MKKKKKRKKRKKESSLNRNSIRKEIAQTLLSKKSRKIKNFSSKNLFFCINGFFQKQPTVNNTREKGFFVGYYSRWVHWPKRKIFEKSHWSSVRSWSLQKLFCIAFWERKKKLHFLKARKKRKERNKPKLQKEKKRRKSKKISFPSVEVWIESNLKIWRQGKRMKRIKKRTTKEKKKEKKKKKEKEKTVAWKSEKRN